MRMQSGNLLDSLNDDQQRELLAKLQNKFGGQDRTTDTAEPEAELWDQLNNALDIRVAPSLPRFRASFGAGLFTDAALTFQSFVASSVAAGTRKPIRRLVGIASFRALATHLASRDLAPTYSGVLSNIERLPFAVDLLWPGYARCRLLHMVARAA